MGRAILAAAEEDARESGAQGMAAWGVSIPFWMKASWFKKRGYEVADRDGISVLLWKLFSPQAKALAWIKRKNASNLDSKKVKVTCFVNGWCQAQNLVFERAKRVAQEFGDDVIFEEIDTSDKETMSK